MIAAYILIQAEAGKAAMVAAAFRDLPGVSETAGVAGPYDVIARAQAPDIDELNFAVFRAALERGERIGAGPVLRIWRRFLVFISRWFQIESLYKFNAKFCPVWEPRFFLYPGTRDTPRIAMAALEAEAFLVWPKLEVKRHARRLARVLGLGKLRARVAERRRSPSALRGAG